MSTATGTATDYLDLLAKLRTFLTTDTTLVSLGQEWTELKTNSTPYTRVEGGQTNTITFESYLQAPGLSTTEQIFINIGAYTNASTGLFNWRMVGALGFLTGNTFFLQPGISPQTFMLLWGSSIPYWFIANGQRVIVVAQVSGNFEMCYLGKFLPDATPGQYPYPVFIGGTAGDATPLGGSNGNDSSASIRIHSDVSNEHAAFFDPCAAFHCDVAAGWQVWNHWNNNNDAHTSGTTNQINPYADDGTAGGGSGGTTTPGQLKWLVTNIDGSYPIMPVRLEQINPNINLVGTLDGVFATTGEGNSSGSSLTVGSDTYLCFQDTFRSGRQNFCAIKFA
jgi:hypothetical protein